MLRTTFAAMLALFVSCASKPDAAPAGSGTTSVLGWQVLGDFSSSNATHQGPLPCVPETLRARLLRKVPEYLATLGERLRGLDAVSDPPANDRMVVVRRFPTAVLIHDGFIYHFAAVKDSGDVHVVREGGYFGVWQLLGPIGRRTCSGRDAG